MLEAFLKIPISGQLVILILFLFMVTATVIIVERSRFWWRISQQHPRFTKQFLELYRDQPELAEAKIKRHIDLPIARIFAAALALDRPSADEFRLAMESELQAEIPMMKRFNSILELFVGLSPLLGLIGTVTGLITAFGSLNIGDIGGTKTAGVAAGISEALLTTAVGLVVAAICLVFASLFRTFYQRQLALIQESGGQFELMYRRRSGETSNAVVIDQLSAALRQLVNSSEIRP